MLKMNYYYIIKRFIFRENLTRLLSKLTQKPAQIDRADELIVVVVVASVEVNVILFFHCQCDDFMCQNIANFYE